MNHLIASLLIVSVTLIMVGGCLCSEPCESPQPSAPINEDGFGMPIASTQVQAVNRNDAGLQGFYSKHGMEIYWKGTTSEGVDTLDVVNAAITRMQFEQDTDLASDTNARALAHLMQARQELEGKTTTTEDGLPILE